jgi:hypothetical protein
MLQGYSDNDARDEVEIVARAESLLAHSLTIWPFPQ